MVGLKRVRRQAEIRLVAARLFRTRGFSATSMDMLAESLAVNKATLYHYFSSKADILFDVIMEPIIDAAATVETIPLADPPDSQFRALMSAQLTQAHRLADAVAVYFQEASWLDRWLSAEQLETIRGYERTFATRFDQILEQGQLDGLFVRSPIGSVRQAVVGMVGHASRWFRADGSLRLQDIADGYTDLLLDGIRQTGN